MLFYINFLLNIKYYLTHGSHHPPQFFGRFDKILSHDPRGQRRGLKSDL